MCASWEEGIGVDKMPHPPKEMGRTRHDRRLGHDGGLVKLALVHDTLQLLAQEFHVAFVIVFQ